MAHVGVEGRMDRGHRYPCNPVLVPSAFYRLNDAQLSKVASAGPPLGLCAYQQQLTCAKGRELVGGENGCVNNS